MFCKVAQGYIVTGTKLNCWQSKYSKMLM